jgi:hypothetical protein
MMMMIIIIIIITTTAYAILYIVNHMVTVFKKPVPT